MLSALVLLSMTGVSGCLVEERVHVVEPDGPPTLVEAEPDVWVVAGWDWPVYFIGGFYWTYHGGLWYRSHVHHGDWGVVGVERVPRRIVPLRHDRYIRYRVHRHHRTRIGPQRHRRIERPGPPVRSRPRHRRGPR